MAVTDDEVKECVQRFPVDIMARRPWKQCTFMIIDADGHELLHLGGQQGRFAAGGDGAHKLVALVAQIVEAVNAHKFETQDWRRAVKLERLERANLVIVDGIVRKDRKPGRPVNRKATIEDYMEADYIVRTGARGGEEVL
jgi:hypothetical protein